MVQMRNVIPFLRGHKATPPSGWSPMRQSLPETLQRPFGTSHGRSFKTPQIALAHKVVSRPGSLIPVFRSEQTVRPLPNGEQAQGVLGSGNLLETPKRNTKKSHIWQSKYSI